MKPPRNIKKIQWLTGCTVALGHFMPRFVDKCQPFFHVLRRRANFKRDKEADKAFQALKIYLAHLPKIASPLPGEKLLLYLVISKHAISVVLVVERNKEQVPVYYVSYALAGARINYPFIEKFVVRGKKVLIFINPMCKVYH